MSQNDKLIRRVLSVPADLSYGDFVHFMKIFGFEEDDTPNGSRVKFYKITASGTIGPVFVIHKPHGKSGAIMKVYMIRQAIEFLKEHEKL